jgi:hypothetical protein
LLVSSTAAALRKALDTQLMEKQLDPPLSRRERLITTYLADLADISWGVGTCPYVIKMIDPPLLQLEPFIQRYQ